MIRLSMRHLFCRGLLWVDLDSFSSLHWLYPTRIIFAKESSPQDHMKHLFLLSVLYSTLMATAPAFAQPDSNEPVVREYILEASILGYKGIGGTIDGIRNPILQAAKGERVQITIVNTETLVHDIAMEASGVKSGEILEVGETATITFIAEQSDMYYCTIPGHRTAGMEGVFQLLEDLGNTVAGIPVTKKGRVLNLGFEDGTYTDWTVEGSAFGEVPVEGDVVLLRTGELRSEHEGRYWVNGSEINGHRDLGSMTSESFNVSQPYASFLIAGGALGGVRVEVVRASDEEVIFSTSAHNSPTMRPVVVNLEDHQDVEVFLRIIDEETGTSEIPYIRDNQNAYISFDDFKLYSERPAFTNEFDPSELYIMPPILELPNAGLSGEAAVAAMEVPDGFAVSLAASEPDVVRPIAFTHDDRGRLWVVEAHTYPVPAPEGEGKDRILIFEDTNGDGTLDSRKIFKEGLNLVSGIEYGFGGVWVGAAPYLMFIPVDKKTDKPAGEPEILLDGWGTQDTHETLNSLRWGPDGWLYGNHGIFTHSNVGKPGVSDDERTQLNGAIWRYHPTEGHFEVYAEGTSNPWGLDFNENGHPFVTACVIPHLFHVIRGARYTRQYGDHFNPYIYQNITTHADHVHWVGDKGPHAGNHRSDVAGGGHAHAGAMFYLGGSWPEEYHDRLFMNNIHGFRANTDIIERRGSGYVGRHGDDFLFAHDSWSQMLNFRYGPDGSIHVIDWYDKNQCHSPNPDVHDKTLGRIFKISHENDSWTQVDLQEKSVAELVEYQLHENEWYARHARRILQERGIDPKAQRALLHMLNGDQRTYRLRAMWTLYVTDRLSDKELMGLLDDPDDVIRSWVIQLVANKEISNDMLQKFAVMARNDASAMVRLYLASAMQYVPLEKRWDIVSALMAHIEDSGDHNIPQMIWYAAEPMIASDMQRGLDVVLSASLPRLLPFAVQRIAAVDSPEALQVLARALETASPEQQIEILKGLNQMIGGTE